MENVKSGFYGSMESGMTIFAYAEELHFFMRENCV